MAAKENEAVQELSVPTLQTKLREQKQIVDFLPGRQESFSDAENRQTTEGRNEKDGGCP